MAGQEEMRPDKEFDKAKNSMYYDSCYFEDFYLLISGIEKKRE